MLVDDKVSVKQDAKIAGSLYIFAEVDKMPGLVVIHSGGGNYVKPVRAFSNQADNSHGTCIVVGLQLKASHVVEKAIQVLPHLRTNLLANLAGIFAGSADTLPDRKSATGIGYQ